MSQTKVSFGYWDAAMITKPKLDTSIPTGGKTADKVMSMLRVFGKDKIGALNEDNALENCTLHMHIQTETVILTRKLWLGGILRARQGILTSWPSPTAGSEYPCSLEAVTRVADAS